MTTDHETIEEARALDAWLAADVVAPPSAGLRRSILLDFEARSTVGFWRAVWRELGGLRIAGPALTASLAVGIAVAAMLEPATSPPDTDVATEEAPGYAEFALLDGAYEEYVP